MLFLPKFTKEYNDTENLSTSKRAEKDGDKYIQK